MSGQDRAQNSVLRVLKCLNHPPVTSREARDSNLVSGLDVQVYCVFKVGIDFKYTEEKLRACTSLYANFSVKRRMKCKKMVRFELT